MSTAVHMEHQGDLTPYLTYACMPCRFPSPASYETGGLLYDITECFTYEIVGEHYQVRRVCLAHWSLETVDTL